jgi:hypothetical protein
MQRLSTRIGAIWQKIEDFFCINAVELLCSRSIANRISVSNWIDYEDGAGAQTQRILSIISLAKHYEFCFELNPIKNIEVQPLDHINSEAILKSEIIALNSWISEKFSVRTRDGSHDYQKIKNSREFFAAVFSVFLSEIFTSNSETKRLMIKDAYFLTKQKPNVWGLVIPTSSKTNIRDDSKINHVAHLHFRLSTFSPSGDRFIPIDYYKKILDRLVSHTSEQGRKIKFVIHTDFNNPVTDSKFFLAHATPQSLKYWVNLGLLTHDFEVDLNIINNAREQLNQLLSGYNDVDLYEENTWASEWESMASADWLVISKSSFSLIGALLNKSGYVIAPKSWHPTLSHWILEDS